MPFSKSVSLSRLISLLTCNIPAKWIRLVCLVIFFAVVISSLPVHLKYDSANAQSSGRLRTQGPPSRNLPNLNETRGIEHGTPKIMPPVPATKCRGRDEKCKKARGKISNNLPDNQDRLLAYADYRSRRDYAGWLKIVIPALSVLDDLIYGSARMISDFPDTSYRTHGDVLTKSAVKLATPRDLSTGSAVKPANTRNSATLPLITTNSQDPCFANVPADHWKGEYYGFKLFVRAVDMVRDDGVGFLNFDWGTGTPSATCGSPPPASPGIYPDIFDVTWTRTINFTQDLYRFTVTADDGVRFYVDGQLIIDTWAFFAPTVTNQTVDIFLTAGNHELKLEYYEWSDVARVNLSWVGTGCLVNVPTDRWRGEYFNNTSLQGNPVMVHDDGDGFLNFNWGGGSPGSACGVNADNFSARWTRTVNFAAGTYRFTATADDGVRLYVDGQLTQINNWAGPPNTYTADIALTAGNHEIKMEFAEYWGLANASLSWATSPVGDLSMALVDPNNRIGSPDKDLLSRNCNWSLPLLGLPGRAGMDLGLVLSLNSLIYTRAGSAMHFDPDQGDLGPGFKLGFPEIRNAFFNTDAGVQSYLLSMPSGSRVEFRQISTNVYEAVDSSYMRLTHDPVNSVFVLRTTDGTQVRFEDVTGLGDYKCKQIKDRQGNFITITYGSLAEIRRITDTLGREIDFNYDTFNHLISITQDWGGQTHTWATFAYGTQTIQTNFPGLTLNGTTNGAQESVLLRVGLADGTVYSFEYNTYAQVKTFRKYAPNNSNPVSFPGDYFQRAYTTYGLPDNAADPQTDCPRATSRTDWAYDWNPGVTYVYAADPGRTWGQVTFPDGTIYKEFFATTGWQRGLTTQTENWAGGVREKWTTLQWTQDNTGVSYRLNPRVTETIVHDKAGNRRRTKMDYTSFGLVSRITEYGADTTTVLRLTETEYNLSAVYTDRRIIGLPSAVYLYDGNNTLFSKRTYKYDLGGAFLESQGPPIQHDTANYGSGFEQGRGNLNETLSWDVTAENNELKASKNEIGYNTSGSVIFTRDPLGHQRSVIYDDSFSDGQIRNTYAYPTTMTAPETPPSFIQYNYNFGGVTWTQDPKGAAVTRTYTADGRIERITNGVNGAYTRYFYAPDQRFMETFTTINDLNPANEFYSATFFDGDGRVRVTASNHPTSVGQWKAQFNVYDEMGRLAQQSNPMEINGSWQPTGDDTGLAWTTQAYDWQGRRTVTTNQDGTTKEVLYGGCGCAGGQVAVTRDEVGRRQKMTYDILGRLKTTQTLFIQSKDQPLDGNGPVYTTTTNTCNVRDQVTNVNVRDDASGVSQNTQMVYDGHARLKQRWLPIYLGNPQSATPYDSYEYYNDDTLMAATDPRGAVRSYAYNARRLVTNISYSGGGGEVVPLTPDTFTYDEAGNRLTMANGVVSKSYVYDQLSRMTSETHQFSGFAQAFTLGYEYNLAGHLKKITDPWGASITYTFNKAGEVIAATGNAAGQVYGNFDAYNNQLITQFAANVKYRAWGGLKSFTNGDIVEKANFALNYNTRLSLTRFEASGVVTEPSYYPDARVKDVIDWYHRPPLTYHNTDRHYVYDHVGRVNNATAGDGTPYSLAYAYDAWNRIISRTGSNWNTDLPIFNHTYDANGRDTAMTYDEAGNVTDPYQIGPDIPGFNYDAAGRQANIKNINGQGVVIGGNQQHYDGDGLRVRATTVLFTPPTASSAYTIRSSVLGGKVIAVTSDNTTGRTVYIYLNGERIASQDQYLDGLGGTHRFIFWEHKEPVIGSYYSHNRRNQLKIGSGGQIETMVYGRDALTDPTGGHVDPFGGEPIPIEVTWPEGAGLSHLTDFSGGCHSEGTRVPCDVAMRQVNSGGAIVQSIDPWFGLTPGVGSEGAIPVWDVTGWRPGQNGDVGTNIIGLTFAFGPQEQPGDPEPEPTSTPKPVRCTVILASRPLDSAMLKGVTLGNNYHHAYVTVQQTGDKYPIVYHAFPVEVGERNLLIGSVNTFDHTDRDKQLSKGGGNLHSSQPLELDGPCDKIRESFDTTVRKLNEKKIDYEYPISSNTANNSNAFAYTLLQRWSPMYARTLQSTFFDLKFRRNSVPGYYTLLPID